MPQREKIQDQSAPSENIQIVFMRAAVPLLKRNTYCTLFNAFNLFIPVSQTAANVRMQLLCQIYSFLKIASSKRTWIFPWFSDSWQGENISLHCVRMERKVLQMLSSNQPIQPDTESIFRATHCRSMLPTHNLNIIAWEKRKRGEVETSAVRHLGSTWFTSHQNHKGYTFKFSSSK